MQCNLARFLMFAIVSLAAITHLSAAEEVKKIRTIEGITEYALPNGVQVLLFPDESQPKVTVNLTLFVGSRHEGYGEAGMAHLLEHMLFKGTPTHPNIPKELNQRGANFNGTTWVDRTNYYETLPAGDENLEFAIRMEADRMMNSNVKGEDLASEMSVVRNEFERGENMPSEILGQRMEATAYEWHNYGKSTIGNRADIERVPIEKLRVFYKKYYQPDNAMLVVAGKFDPEKALALIEKYFGSIPRPKRVLDSTYTEEPAQDGERFVTLRRVGDVAVVGAVYHICSGSHPEFASVLVLEDVLTAAPAGRLYKALVETKKASQVQGIAYQWHDPSLLRLMAEVSKGNDPQVVLEAMLDTIGELNVKKVTAEEVERAKTKLLKRRELDASKSDEVAVELSEWAAQGDWRLYFLNRDRIEQVTAESVNAVAEKYLKASNRTVGIFYPTEKPDQSEVPPAPNLASAIGDYQGREAAAQGEAFDANPASIESRTKRLVLSSGVHAALLQKGTRNQAVTLRLNLNYGNEQNLKNLTSACEFLPDLMARGTKKLTRQQLQDALDSLGATLQAGGQAGEATFAIETKRDKLPAVLELLRQVLREPSLPESELEILQRQQISALEEARTETTALAQRAARRAMYPYAKDDPRYIPTIDEEIEMVQALNVGGLRKLYEDFVGGEHGELVIVGDFDPDAVMPVLNATLNDWKSEQAYERLRYTAFPDVKGENIEILTPGKANATYFGSESIAMSDADPDYAAMAIGDFALGGGALSSRLADRIRQKEGLSYGVGSGFQARALDDRAGFYVYAISNPTNMPKVKVAVLEEIDRFLKDGITEKELATAVAGYLQGKEVDRSSDQGLSHILAETVEAGRTMEYYVDLEQKIKALTPAQVLEAFKKHIDPERLIVVTAGDFKAKAGEKQPAEAKK